MAGKNLNWKRTPKISDMSDSERELWEARNIGRSQTPDSFSPRQSMSDIEKELAAMVPISIQLPRVVVPPQVVLTPPPDTTVEKEAPVSKSALAEEAHKEPTLQEQVQEAHQALLGLLRPSEPEEETPVEDEKADEEHEDVHQPAREILGHRRTNYLLKGINPLTEHYGACYLGRDGFIQVDVTIPTSPPMIIDHEPVVPVVVTEEAPAPAEPPATTLETSPESEAPVVDTTPPEATPQVEASTVTEDVADDTAASNIGSGPAVVVISTTDQADPEREETEAEWVETQKSLSDLMKGVGQPEFIQDEPPAPVKAAAHEAPVPAGPPLTEAMETLQATSDEPAEKPPLDGEILGPEDEAPEAPEAPKHSDAEEAPKEEASDTKAKPSKTERTTPAKRQKAKPFVVKPLEFTPFDQLISEQEARIAAMRG